MSDDEDDTTMELSLDDVMSLQSQDGKRRAALRSRDHVGDDATAAFKVPAELLREASSPALGASPHSARTYEDIDATGTITAAERAELLAQVQALPRSGASRAQELVIQTTATLDDEEDTYTVSAEDRYRLLMQTVPPSEQTVEVDRSMLHTREGVQTPAEILHAFEASQQRGPVRLDFLAEVDDQGRLLIPSALLRRHNIRPGARLIIHAELQPEDTP